MAFRPHFAAHVTGALPMLASVALDSDPNVRRFAVEVSRPRSVWGSTLNF